MSHDLRSLANICNLHTTVRMVVVAFVWSCALLLEEEWMSRRDGKVFQVSALLGVVRFKIREP